ncbi:MAG TPA: N,N-dimethylformamidase beta subunit family domain-containing protein, partial [Actinomycetota bacterium]|nr:N,N-dimethylformamidase beta subunit family domain-containing protein [Actinomycetota bacterium]
TDTISAYTVDILRLGYYGGTGARKVVSFAGGPLVHQPNCTTDATTGLVDCSNWSVTDAWAVPATAVSGLYLAHLVPNSGSGGSLIPFVVRNDASHADIELALSTEDWEAYNTWGYTTPLGGGNSLYQCTQSCPPGNPQGYKGAFEVSYNRPWSSAVDNQGRSWFLSAEWEMIMFLEANGYNVTYVAGSDIDDQSQSTGSLLLNHKVLMSVGHDEYWSGNQYANVVYARDRGVNLAFFSGNEVFWKTEFIDGGRVLVCYKETHFNAPTGPLDPPTWTGAWADPRFSPPADGGQAQNALTGQYSAVDCCTGQIQVPWPYADLRLWRNTAIAAMTPGQAPIGLGDNTLGYEWDVDSDNGFRPAGEFDLSSTPLNEPEVFTDYGTFVGPAAVTHSLTEYRAASGALVFGAGTVQWSWGLDPTGYEAPPDRNMQQATVNVLADMHAQPVTLLGGLVPATASTDTTPPSSTILYPRPDDSVAAGSSVTVDGTASDTGGGVVAGVEVSTDGGATWHPATVAQAATTVTWSYTWAAAGYPSARLESRAVDDSGNLETPSAGVTVNVGCPCSLWAGAIGPSTTSSSANSGQAVPGPGGAGPDAARPQSADSGDPDATVVGVEFSVATAGEVTGIQFYKAAANTGTHVGTLFSESGPGATTGAELASATFSNESPSGWQQVTFASPVAVSPGTSYVASYYAPNGHYAQDQDYFYGNPQPPSQPPSILTSGPLSAVEAKNSTVNGLYLDAFENGGNPIAPGSFPSVASTNASNFWVDPVFVPTGESAVHPGSPIGVVASPGASSATVSWTAPFDGGAPVTGYTIAPFQGTTALPPVAVGGGQTSLSVTGLTDGEAYSFTVAATNAAGTGPASLPTTPVTPEAAGVPAAPTAVRAVAGDGLAAVVWTPGGDGGSPITSYAVVASPGGITVMTAATGAYVTGLTD